MDEEDDGEERKKTVTFDLDDDEFGVNHGPEQGGMNTADEITAGPTTTTTHPIVIENDQAGREKIQRETPLHKQMKRLATSYNPVATQRLRSSMKKATSSATTRSATAEK